MGSKSMSLTINIYYTGENEMLLKIAREFTKRFMMK